MPQIANRSSKVPDFEVAPGLFGYRRVEVRSTPEDKLTYDILATIEPCLGRYVVTNMTVSQKDSGPPIQRGEIAKISVEPFIREAAREAMQSVGEDKWRPVAPTPEFWDRIESGEGIRDDDLPQLAALYRWIRLQDGRPTALMAEQFQVSPATIRRWLSRAVEAGHLNQDERTK